MVVFLVALPLCMGIAIASGAPPALGLMTGIVGGLVVGFMAGAPLQVSGPAAGLSVIVYELIQEHGLAGLGVMVLLGGAIQLAAGLMKLGQWFRAISPSVIQGMLAGIGVLIFASQFHVMVDAKPQGSGLENLFTIPMAIYKAIFPLDGDAHHMAAGIGLLTIATIVLWNTYRPKTMHYIPGPLLAAVAATAVAGAFHFPIQYIDVPSNLLAAANLPSGGSLTALFTDPRMLVGALTIAFVASAETLLCATAVDRMAQGHRTDYNRELAAQGVGNMICGFLGALPMTGVIVRSSANVQAGAQTRNSAIFHGVWLLAFVAAFPQLLRLIPTASLAGILVYTGYKLVNIAEIRKLQSYGRSEVLIYMATMWGIVIIDLLTGVLIGLALAIVKLAYTFSHLEIHVETSPDARRADVRLEGAATFMRLPQLAAALEGLPAGTEAHIHFEHLHYIDHACIELLTNWEKQHATEGTRVVIEWKELTDRYHRQNNRASSSTASKAAAPAEAS